MVPESAGLIQMISNAGWVVQLVLLVLIIFSITSWGIIFIKYRTIQKAYRESLIFVENFWKSRNLSDAFNRAKQLRFSPVARVYRAGFMELKRVTLPNTSGTPRKTEEASESLLAMEFSVTENVKRTLRRSINAEITRMAELVPFLATAGNTAPFIGLFGTVWGIMNAFQGIGQRGSATLAVVAPGISEALVATAAGLAVAIPSVIAFNYFNQKIRIIESELQNFAADFLNIVERDILSVKGER